MSNMLKQLADSLYCYQCQHRKTLAPEKGGDPTKLGRIFRADTDNSYYCQQQKQNVWSVFLHYIINFVAKYSKLIIK